MVFVPICYRIFKCTKLTTMSYSCVQVDPQALFAKNPLPLSQGVLLSLVQQLGCDLANDTSNKLTWIREAALALNLADPVLAPHMRPFLHQLYQNLHSQMGLTPPTGEVTSALRLVIHVVNSLLSSCKWIWILNFPVQPLTYLMVGLVVWPCGGVSNNLLLRLLTEQECQGLLGECTSFADPVHVHGGIKPWQGDHCYCMAMKWEQSFWSFYES